MNFFVTFHETEKIRNSWQKYLYKKVFSTADSIFLSDVSLEKNAYLIYESAPIAVASKNFTSFMNQVRDEYAMLMNKQQKRLSRPK